MYCHTEETKEIIQKYLISNTNLLEAGVCGGRTAAKLMNLTGECKKWFKEVWGFDSFRGLPKESPGLWVDKDWYEGNYNAVKYFKLNSIEEAINLAKKNMGNGNNIHIVEGFFEQSLTKELGQSLTNSCGFLNIDCDLYISTKQFLEWVFTNSILINGCIIRFDDWLGTKYNPYHPAGENLAWEEMIQKYNIMYEETDKENVFIYHEHTTNR